ncbi:Nucleotidyltransferase domain-containing protein [Paenibacillus uliginis N3/975]|uniref:Nucleotidyltransferase domain-containing protein n=1 Tax=Paenibacillus uliginis N3/975 TaxID=1313296 RepID=A0A1X7H7G4_9BACL|nr:Nucleotidyltransferase domain-containing protein [Paenibacillus uliginis N3/975]
MGERIVKTEPFEAAKQLISRDYPNCLIAVLGGSAGRGEHNEQSDLDIVLIDDSVEDFNRKTIESFGWVVELFFLTTSGYREQFDAGVMAGNPTLQRILAEGRVIHSRPEGEKIREEAQNDLDYGPLPYTSFDIDVARYAVTEFMMDLKGSDKRVEMWFIAQKLTTLLCEFILRANQHWTGEGKTLYRLVSAFNSSIAADLEDALERLYLYDDREALIELVPRLLEPYGGPHLIGYEE